MTKSKAFAQARREISKPYRTVANRRSTTWGLSTTAYGDRATQSDIGTYHEAWLARTAWIAERAAVLTAEV